MYGNSNVGDVVFFPRLLKPLIAVVKCERCGWFKKCVYAPELEQWVCAGCLEVLLDILCFFQSDKKKGVVVVRLIHVVLGIGLFVLFMLFLRWLLAL